MDKTQKSSTYIADQLVADISAGLISAGDSLDEAGLSKRFGVSRTPVREALIILRSKKILVKKQGKGVCVETYSKSELAQMFECMQELESICAKIASNRLTLLSRAEIIKTHRECCEMAEAGDRVGFLKANEEFHFAIYRATQNQYIQEMAMDFRYKTGPFRAKRYRTKQDFIQSAKSHQAIVDTILKNENAQSHSKLKDRAASFYMEVLAQN